MYYPTVTPTSSAPSAHAGMYCATHGAVTAATYRGTCGGCQRARKAQLAAHNATAAAAARAWQARQARG